MTAPVRLTPLQRAIVRFRRAGLSNSEIAYELQGPSRESVCVTVSYLRRKGVRIPVIPRSKATEPEEE